MMSKAEDYMRELWPRTHGSVHMRTLGLAKASWNRFGGDYDDHLAFVKNMWSDDERVENMEWYVRHVLPRVKASPSKDIRIARQASLRGYGTTQECLQAVRRIMAES